MSKVKRIQARHRVTSCISPVSRHRETSREWFNNPMIQAKIMQARNRVTDCISQVSPGVVESRNQKRHMWTIITGCQKKERKMLRRHLYATSPIIPLSAVKWRWQQNCKMVYFRTGLHVGPVSLRDEERFPSDAHSRKVRVFNDSIFCTSQRSLDCTNASEICEKKAEAFLK